MSKLTREERLAQGWRECWGCWGRDEGWWTGGAGDGYEVNPRRIFDFESWRGARDSCAPWQIPRRFWRRVKPKPETAAEFIKRTEAEMDAAAQRCKEHPEELCFGVKAKPAAAAPALKVGDRVTQLLVGRVLEVTVEGFVRYRCDGSTEERWAFAGELQRGVP